MYIILLACLTACLAAQIDDPKWLEYKEKYGKDYTDHEDATRYEIWSKHVKESETHNALYADMYEQGVNEYTDLTNDEFFVKFGGPCKFPYRPQSNDTLLKPNPNVQIPESVNWLDKGAVTYVKNQGSCGSCYSFSTTGGLEGAWFLKHGKLISLSEQQVVDCSTRYGNLGCGGGWYHDSWRYLHDCGGSQTERSYPYETRLANCRFNRAYVAATVAGYQEIPNGDENTMAQAVATAGPVAVAIDASHYSFRSYKHGVYYEPQCGNTIYNLNHAVLVVGYGNEGGYGYWLVKNSWGDWFGASGYIKMLRNYYNHCGIATRSAYPTV